jgi:tetratricopeptide (TPR) repeat protein
MKASEGAFSGFERQACLALAALFLSVFCLYLRSLGPAFHADDSPETIAAGATLGIQHPPGYPLDSLMGRLAVLLGPGPAPFDVNLLSVLAGAIAAVLAACLLYTLALEFAPWAAEHRRLGLFALGGGAVMAVLPTLWFESTTAKGGIYALNLALSLGGLLAILRVRDAGLSCSVETLRGGPSTRSLTCGCPSPRALALAALMFGLGLANHWTSQLALLPAYALLLGEARWKRRAWPPRSAWGRMAFPPLLLVAAGAALYGVLPLRSRLGAPLMWGDPSTWAGFWGVFTRGRYAGLEASKTWPAFWALILRMAGDAASDWTWPGLAVLGLGWALLFRKRLWLAVGLFSLPLGLALAVACKANPPADALFIIDPYLAPFQAGLGLGLAGFFAVPPLRRLLGPGLLVAALALGAWNWRVCDQAGDFRAWDYTNNLLLGAPRGALLVCEGDSNVAGPLVPLLVEGRRRDLTQIVPVLIDEPWYRASLLLRDPGLKLPPFYGGPAEDIAWIADANADRPLLWTNSHTPDWVDEQRLLPRGLEFLRTVGKAPFAPGLLSANRIWPAFALRGILDASGPAVDPITGRLVLDQYSDAEQSLADAYQAAGAYGPAEEEYRLLGLLRPGQALPWLLAGSMAWRENGWTHAASLWKRAGSEEPSNPEVWADLGLVALKQGSIAKALGLARHALSLDPGLADAGSLLAMAGEAPLPGTGARAVAEGARAATEGDALAREGRHEEALADYDRAWNLGFASKAFYRNRGISLGRLGRIGEAVQSLQLAEALDPGDAELVKLQGYFLFNAGRLMDGLALLQKALAMEPKDADLQRLVREAKAKAGADAGMSGRS